MSRPMLEDFTATDDSPAEPHFGLPGENSGQAVMPAPQAVETSRLDGYEAGYQAGWDDATRAQAAEQGRIGAEFARNLQDLGFTFHEARAHVMHALEPLLAGMVERVLPRLVSESIGQTIVEELMPLAAAAADTPIEVVVSPDSFPVLETLLAGATSIPFSLVEEPSLATGQVFLRSGKLERHIDFTSAVDRIGTAINGLYDLNEKAFNHG